MDPGKLYESGSAQNIPDPHQWITLTKLLLFRVCSGAAGLGTVQPQRVGRR